MEPAQCAARCLVCGAGDTTRELVTYKNVWTRCDRCGCFSRRLRQRYPLQWLASLLPERLPRLRALKRLLGPRAIGAEGYRFYEELLMRGDLVKWSLQYDEFRGRINAAGVSVDGRTLLDVSGEPGLFGAHALRDGAKSVTVTALADNVAAAITKVMGVSAITYDFNKDRLRDLVRQPCDLVSCRYALGYCENVPQFFSELRAIAAPAAHVYVSFSPPSLGTCSRWMFEDYTNLRQYTKEHVLLAAAESGFRCMQAYDEGSYPYDRDLHPVEKSMMKVYRHVLCRDLLTGSSYFTQFQHNVGLLLRAD